MNARRVGRSLCAAATALPRRWGALGCHAGATRLRAALLATCFFTGPAGATAARPSPGAVPPSVASGDAELDRTVDAAGLRLHLHCAGRGTPTVVFEAGSGSDGSVWRSVQPGVARVTRACAYDRAGLGYSGPGRKPRTSDRMAGELHALLEAAEVPPPHVLVGHSAGGLNVLSFASEFPGEVVGMVLVDATTPEVGERLWSRLSAGERRELRDRMRRGPDGWDFDSFIESMKRVAQAPSLGDLPLVVLTRGRDGPPPPGVKPEEAARRFEIWKELQAALPRLSTNSRHVVVPEARHFIQWDAPGAVVRAVRDVVMAARTGRRLEGAESSGNASGAVTRDAPSARGARDELAVLGSSADAGGPAAPSNRRSVVGTPEPATLLTAARAPSSRSPAAGAAAAGEVARASSPTLWERFRQGGLSMFVLLGLSTLALAASLELALGFRTRRVGDRALFEQAETLWRARRFADLEALCRRSESVAARVLLAIVQHRHHPYVEVDALAGDVASGELRESMRRTHALSVVATLSPLIGLFGTVVGLVEAFDAIAASRQIGDPSLVAAGISKALVTTAAGLMVGIPALGARHFFVSRIQRAGAELERHASDFVRRWLLTERGQP